MIIFARNLDNDTEERGANNPSFLLQMDKQAVINRVEELIEDSPYFLVDVTMDAGNNIRVEIDGPEGINIAQCIEISRGIEGYFDREVEDYGLEVSSPGLDKPFKVWPQYQKSVGRNLKVVLTDGREVVGTLKSAEQGEIVIVTERKEKVPGKKKKVVVQEEQSLKTEGIKTAQIKLKF